MNGALKLIFIQCLYSNLFFFPEIAGKVARRDQFIADGTDTVNNCFNNVNGVVSDLAVYTK